MKRHTTGLLKTLLGAAACLLIFSALPAEAQVGAGGRTKGKPRGKKPKQPRPQQRDEVKAHDSPGRHIGKIQKFKAAKDDKKGEDFLGTLTVRPLAKGKSLKLNVNRPEDADESTPASIQIKVGDHVFDSEEWTEILWRGLHCTAEWGFKDPDAKRKVRELRGLTLDTMVVMGKIDKIEDGLVYVKGVPARHEQWPDVIARNAAKMAANPMRANKNNKPTRIARRTLKLKPVEDMSKFFDEDKDETDLDAFEIGQEIKATVVYGKPHGMIVSFKHPTDDDTVDAPRGKPPPRQPPPNPRGPRGGRPGRPDR